jgi:hypothetical protein
MKKSFILLNSKFKLPFPHAQKTTKVRSAIYAERFVRTKKTTPNKKFAANCIDMVRKKAATATSPISTLKTLIPVRLY